MSTLQTAVRLEYSFLWTSRAIGTLASSSPPRLNRIEKPADMLRSKLPELQSR